MGRRCLNWVLPPAWLLVVLVCGCAPSSPFWLAYPEQRHFDIRDPGDFPKAPLAPVPPPATVSKPAPTVPPAEMSLDQAIHIALANSQVVRVLAGITATASGRTIYDPAITNTSIDVARSVFDPVFTVNRKFTRIDEPAATFSGVNPVLASEPGAIINPLSVLGVTIPHNPVDQYTVSSIVSKKTLVGGTLTLDSEFTYSRFPSDEVPLNPQEQTSFTMSYTQPLLRGAGLAANLAPIVIARINTEITFFQYKDAVQELVRGTIEAYWAVVFARTDVWVKEQQVEQLQFAYDLAEARLKAGQGDVAPAAQAKSSLANFKAALVVARANLLQREAALRSILGLAPTVPERLTLTTPQVQDRIEPRWEQLLDLAGANRPDLIELKLNIEADQQTWIVANNQARPQLDLVSYYRWNGLEGTTPSGTHVATTPGQFGDYSVGVNFSMPLGLRQDRARLRSAELTLMRDYANLDQGMFNVIHSLATSVRNLSQYYEQFLAFKEARTAARENLEAQTASYKSSRIIYLNVLQAIADWGNAVSSEAQSLAQYNTELGNLERQTGTILETHGVRFLEERYRSIGPLGRCFSPRCYPAAIPPSPNLPVYPPGTEPAEKMFERDRPLQSAPLETAPPPRPLFGPPTGAK
jgi:outer membrane protein TolC